MEIVDESKRRTKAALEVLETIMGKGASEATRRQAAKDLLDHERASGIKHDRVVGEEILGVFIAVLGEVREINSSLPLEGHGVGDIAGTGEDKSLLPL